MKMKVDLSKFKLKHKDDKHATLVHEDGHEFKVAIHALHPMNRKNLDDIKLSEGGKVKEDRSKLHKAMQMNSGAASQSMPMAKGGDPTQRNLLPGDKIPNSIEKGIVSRYEHKMAKGGKIDAEKLKHPAPKHPVQAEPIEDDIEKLPHPEPKHPVEYEAMAEGGSVSADDACKNPDCESFGSAHPNCMCAEGGIIKMADGGMADGVPVPAIPGENGLPPNPETPSDSNPPQTAQMSPKTGMQPADLAMTQPEEQQMSQAPMPAASPKPTEAPLPNAVEAGKNQIKAQEKITEGEVALQQSLEKQYKAKAAAENEFKTNYEASTRKIINEGLALRQDIKDQHIDPNHFLGSMDTGNKITTAIALAMGGLGGAMSGTGNKALEFINSQIDRDIEAQKAELGKKHTLLSANQQQFQDVNAAAQMTRLQMNDLYLSKMEEAVAKAQSPLAKARGQQMIAGIQAQMAPMVQQAAMHDMLNQPTNGKITADPANFVTAMVPPDKQKEVFAQIEAAQNTKHMAHDILKSFDTAVKENTVLRTGAGLLRTPGSVSALHQSMQPTFKDLEGTVRQAAMDNTFKNITPMPGDTEHKIQQKRAALLGYLQSKASAPMAKGFGIDLNKFESTAPTRETKVVNGKTYERGPNGEAIEVK